MMDVSGTEAQHGVGGARGRAGPRKTRPVNWEFIASVVLFGTLWELVARSADLFFLPPLSEIMRTLWELIADGTIPEQLVVSLGALAGGIAAAAVLGILLGTGMGISPGIRFVLDPYVNALMSAPMTPFVPLFIIVFGLSYTTRVVTVFVFAVLPILVNTAAGMAKPRQELLEMGSSFGATPWQLFWRVRLPMAYPLISAGLRLGTARGVDGLVIGEVLIAVVGLGGLVARFGSAFTSAQLWAVVFFIVALALVLAKGAEYLGGGLVR
jgi:NitT/TauT family transport system permease protein